MFYSENIVFIGGEFATSHSTPPTRFSSIGLIAPSMYTGSGKRVRPGSELYLKIEPECASDRRPENQAAPGPEGEVVSKAAAVEIINEFLGGSKPYLLADANRLTWMGICDLFSGRNEPFRYTPIDFASILWAAGIAPDADRYGLASRFDIDVRGLRQHHALDDARLLMALYYAVKDYMENIKAEGTADMMIQRPHAVFC